MSRNNPIVAIVGRPNVGKSTLFNRFLKKRRAIVHPQAGITRDRISEITSWRGKKFIIVDTGGLNFNKDVMSEGIKKQVHFAIEEADLILFIVDAKEGIVPGDREISELLRKAGKKVLLVVNKADNEEIEQRAVEYYELGFGSPFPISAMHGRNVGDLLDQILDRLPFAPDDTEEEEKLKLAIVGMPNVGKSSIVNALLGRQISLVTDIPGTTRDSVDTVVKYYGQEIILIDTAGLRKKKSIKGDIEFYSVIRTLQAIDRSNIVCVVLDAVKGMGKQDIDIIRNVVDKKKGMMVVVNKWDLIEKKPDTMANYQQSLIAKLNILRYYPVIFTSALTKRRIFQIYKRAVEIHENLNRRISTAELNDYMFRILKETPPPTYKGKFIKIKYVTQVKTNPPVFAFFCNDPKGIKEDYRRFLENRLREVFQFTGVPLTLVYKRK